jgi:hypothetical protein
MHVLAVLVIYGAILLIIGIGTALCESGHERLGNVFFAVIWFGTLLVSFSDPDCWMGSPAC